MASSTGFVPVYNPKSPYNPSGAHVVDGTPVPGPADTSMDPASDSMTATKTLDTVIKSQQKYYDSTFGSANKRIQQIASGRNAGEVLADVASAESQGGQSADSAAGTLQRQSAGLGLPGSSSSAVRQMGLRRVLAQVDSGNRMAQAAVARQEAAQEYSSSAMVNYSGQANSILGSIARNEADRQAQYMDAKSAADSNTMGLMGKAGGLIIAALA